MESESAAIESDEIVGEFDDDEIEDDLSTLQRERDSESESAEIVDDEIVADDYTDPDAQIMNPRSGAITPDAGDSTGSVDLGACPSGRELLTLSEAVERAAALRAREAARIRDIRRR